MFQIWILNPVMNPSKFKTTQCKMDQNPKPKQKKQPHSTQKQSTPNPKKWPNLPQNLISLIARNPNLMQNITSFGCVVKSWRPVPTNCTPEPDHGPKLVEIFEKDHKNMHLHVVEIDFNGAYCCLFIKKKVLSYRFEAPLINFMGHSHGRLVCMERSSLECCLWESSGSGIHRSRWGNGLYLPPWNRNLPFKSATLNDRNGCNVMVITGLSFPAFAFFSYRMNQNAWILEDCELKERYGVNQTMKFTNCIGFGGKFYALSLQGTVVVIEDVESRFRVTRVGARRAVPSGVSRQFREYLVELDGEILLVFLVSRKSVDFVEGVEVFRLDCDKLLWVKVVSLGCMALFLEDECCMGVNSSKVGCKRNCIYFTHCRVKEWYVYEMGRGGISAASGSDFQQFNEVK